MVVQLWVDGLRRVIIEDDGGGRERPRTSPNENCPLHHSCSTGIPAAWAIGTIFLAIWYHVLRLVIGPRPRCAGPILTDPGAMLRPQLVLGYSA